MSVSNSSPRCHAHHPWRRAGGVKTSLGRGRAGVRRVRPPQWPVEPLAAPKPATAHPPLTAKPPATLPTLQTTGKTNPLRPSPAATRRPSSGHAPATQPRHAHAPNRINSYGRDARATWPPWEFRNSLRSSSRKSYASLHTRAHRTQPNKHSGGKQNTTKKNGGAGPLKPRPRRECQRVLAAGPPAAQNVCRRVGGAGTTVPSPQASTLQDTVGAPARLPPSRHA